MTVPGSIHRHLPVIPKVEHLAEAVILLSCLTPEDLEGCLVSRDLGELPPVRHLVPTTPNASIIVELVTDDSQSTINFLQEPTSLLRLRQGLVHPVVLGWVHLQC